LTQNSNVFYEPTPELKHWDSRPKFIKVNRDPLERDPEIEDINGVECLRSAFEEDRTSVEIVSELLFEDTNVVWVWCVPSKEGLLLIDNTNRVRMVEPHHFSLRKQK
jgi:hypothetical protein